jgi:hypothetical protein
LPLFITPFRHYAFSFRWLPKLSRQRLSLADTPYFATVSPLRCPRCYADASYASAAEAMILSLFFDYFHFILIIAIDCRCPPGIS